MTPDYLICLECESPTYVFDWSGDQIKEAFCSVCGNEDVAEFATESDYEELALDERFASREWWRQQPSKTREP